MSTSHPYTPQGVLRNLALAEEVLREQNHTFDANIMAAAHETIVSLMDQGDAMANAARWSEDLMIKAAVDRYVYYRNRGLTSDQFEEAVSEDFVEKSPWVYKKPESPSGPNHYFYHGDFWREDESDIHEEAS